MCFIVCLSVCLFACLFNCVFVMCLHVYVCVCVCVWVLPVVFLRLFPHKSGLMRVSLLCLTACLSLCLSVSLPPSAQTLNSQSSQAGACGYRIKSGARAQHFKPWVIQPNNFSN